MTTVLVVGTVVSVLLAVAYLLNRRDSGSDMVLDVRKTPERQVEDLTVEQFHELARDHLSERGFVFESSEENYYLARNDEQLYYVKIDPAAELRDPRTMNQFILEVRQSEAEDAIVVTSRAIRGQSYSLAQRTDTEILTPDDLMRDERNSGNEQTD